MRMLRGAAAGWRVARVAVVVGALSMGASSCRGQAVGRQMSPAESAQAVQALVTWFECEECESGELAAVTRYGETVVPNLIAVLNGGLSAANRQYVREELERRYDELAQRARTDTNFRLASSRAEFVALYLGNRDAQFRVRAAQALGAIGGERARDALRTALDTPQRSDVQAVIRRTLAAMR